MPTLLIGVIFGLALVQSLFGVGVLLFGTPLLLSMGFSYEQTLCWLLPASAALSWSQVWEMRSEKLAYSYRKRFFWVCIPILLVALALSLQLNLITPLKYLVLAMLCLSIALRLNERWREKIKTFFAQHLSVGLGLIGLIHGLSNMGGSVLTILASGLYEEKRTVLAAVSLDYAFMASFQMLLLFSLKPELWHPRYFIGSLLTLSARYLIGRNLFALTQNTLYQRLITFLLACNAGLLIWTLV